MSVVLSSLEVVVPLLILLAVGAVINRLGLLPEKGQDVINKLTYTLFLPCMLFASIASSEDALAIDGTYLGYSAGGTFVSFLLIMALVVPLTKDKSKRGALAVGMFRANIAIYGFPLISAFLGPEMRPQVMTMITPIVLLSNILSVVMLEWLRPDKRRFSQLLKSIFVNPLVVAMLLGFSLSILKVRLPSMILSPIESLGNVTTPLAFLMLGASFTFKSSIANRGYNLAAVFVKLFLIPGIFLFLGAGVFGLRGPYLVALLCVFATPTAVTTQAMVKEMGGDHILEGEIITFTTIFSLLSIFLFSVVLQSLGYL